LVHSPAWPSGIVSSEVPGSSLEFPAPTAISFLPFFRNMMKALPLPSPKVLLSLESHRYYGQLRFPYGPNGTSSPYIHPLLPCPAPLRASRATPYDFPCVSPLLPREPAYRFPAVFVKIGVPAFPQRPQGRQLHSLLTRLHLSSLALQPAGLLGPLSEPLSENYVFPVTLHTSLQLRGRTAELPRSDFNRQAICHARHTVGIEMRRAQP
jgi:hypothetical protein